ncbi:MAG: hypothetical protein IIV81_01165 [Clostridia bacterium]|nr:hypothetical protein [Clostridia bacterium]
MKNKMMSMLVRLSGNSGQYNPNFHFEEDVWNYIIDNAPKHGINTIVLDVNDGLEFATHPEIALKGAWTRGKLRLELKKCRERGLTVIPKMNFSAAHSEWLGIYHRMLCTPTYYKVCDDLIKEVYELFDHPAYIHLGMDEEDAKHVARKEFAIFRQGELYWHDLRFLIDSVKDTGAMPWIWSCPLFDNPEEYKKHIAPDEVLLSPWHYNAFRKEHFTPIESRAEYVAYYNEGEYAKMNIKYVEDDPFLVHFREVAIPLMKEGYLYAPCGSVYNRCEYNHSDLLEYFKLNAPDEQIIGFMSAPWFRTLKENVPYFDETFKYFGEAIEKFYKQR